MNQTVLEISNNKGGPLHYLGNRNLSLPDMSGHMRVDNSWLKVNFSLILANTKGKKFRRCYEPFSGSASWSLRAMELDLADEYLINDSNKVLINTLREFRDNPERAKRIYASLVERYNNSNAKKNFFIDTIETYNKAEDHDKSVILPFIINYSWGGIIFNDDKNNIVYRNANITDKSFTGHLQKANLSLENYFEEVDNVSNLLNANKVIFQSGDFIESLSDVQADDLVAMNPPYPENIRFEAQNTAMYFELYSPEKLHQKIMTTVQSLEKKQVAYFMTYGLYNPATRKFALHDESNQLINYFQVIGHEESVFGIALDQFYLSSKMVIPKDLATHIISATDVLNSQNLTTAKALENFYKISRIMHKS